MFKYFLINDGQLELVKTIIKSSDELILLLKEKPKLDGLLKHTITQILLLMAKIIHVLPEILLTEHGNRILKHEITSSYSKALNCWTNFSEKPEKFIDAWIEFIFWWEEYYKLVNRIKDKKQTVFISMN